MSTLDVVNQVVARPPTSSTSVGGANADMKTAALEVINFDQNVKSIFINIFGGITRGEEVAKGIVEARTASSCVRRSSSASTAPTPRGSRDPRQRRHPESKLVSKPTMLEAAHAAVAIANGN